MKTFAPIAAALILLAVPAVAQQAPAPSSNAEMMRIFAEDQGDRAAPNIDWRVVAPRDEQRRAATRKLLADGALHTGEDYNAAAFVFQHGGDANDYLLAHTLAVVAVAKGERKAAWIASATLDRYLMQIGQPQILGTQYMFHKQPQATWTQEPYARDLISDALRKELGVPVQAEQAERMAKMPLPIPANAPKP